MSELQHYGVLGMKWGHRKNASSIIDSTAKSFRRHASKLRGKAESAGAYAYLRTDAKGQVKGSLSKRMSVSNAQAKATRLREKATRDDNIASGIEKAKSLIKGMDMKQSVKTLEKAAGYSKGQQLYNKLLMSNKTRLTFASMDYALNKTNSGKKSV